jgi:hypothetical protein
MRKLVAVLALCCVAAAATAKPTVVTFSRADLARIVGEICGYMPAPTTLLYIRRTTDSSIVYISSEDNREALLMADSEQCSPLSTTTVGLWRADDGTVPAMLDKKEEGRLLMIGETQLRGKRFDVDRSGSYASVSMGTNTNLCAISKPYRTAHTVGLDTQRIFVRKKKLLLVGGNPATRMLEAVPVRTDEAGLTTEASIPVGTYPGDVRVLDYCEATDELLLGGTDASGQTAFVVYNLGSGKTSSVAPTKPGDDQAMFINNRRARSQLQGESGGGLLRRLAPAAGSTR